ncbi:MAG: M20/M25/M40 family metallo-hydrolase [Candidatus Saccharicenans sp.]|uniref:M20/M25/M40 family metallo-hydrolase n=1 Tax=Candidatus Saccharicenans sp. TaxID=2819258 RepID=UPI00404A2BF1
MRSKIVPIRNWWLAAVLSLILIPGCRQSSSPQPAGTFGPELKNSLEIIKNLGLRQEKAHDFLQAICAVGGRLTGSPEAARAVEIAADLMTALGLDRVMTEPVTVRRWVRGEREQALVRSQKFGPQSLNLCALGNSLGTPAEGLEAGVVEISSLEELAAKKDRIAGRIVFFNTPMDRTMVEPFAAYGRAAQFRVHGATEAAKYGAVAVLVRSTTFRLDDNPHTGLMEYDPGWPAIPAAAVSTVGAEKLHLWLQQDPELKLWLRLSCRQEEPVVSANVIGQLTGLEKPEEIILVGGHLDSWDLSPGAHDDAAGCAVALEVLRLIKEAGLKPKRTIRAVLFMDEEFGGSGGRAYAASGARKGEKHLLAIEQDRGGFAPLGLAFSREDLAVKLQPLEEYLRPLGINWIRTGGGGVDIAPLREQGTVLGALIPEAQRYFDYHHCALDVPEAVHPRELELQAVILAMVVYYLAQEGV